MDADSASIIRQNADALSKALPMPSTFSRYIIKVVVRLKESNGFPRCEGSSLDSRASTTETMTMKNIIGRMHGRVILKNVCILEDPSISAASNISTGILVMPTIA